MDNTLFGMKEVYECTLKATYDIEIGGKVIQAGEPIVVFDSLQLVQFNEFKEYIHARGGYGNQAWVSWERTNELDLNFAQGIFSKIHLAILGNVALQHEPVIVPMWEELEIDENLQVTLKHAPADADIWAYNRATGDHLKGKLNGKVITFEDVEPYQFCQVSYKYDCGPQSVIHLGRHILNGYFQITLKTRLKDDMTGKTVTGVFFAPQVKLMSDFSIMLGSSAPPAINRFSVKAFPTGSKGSEKVMDFILLDEDIDSDD